MAAMDDIRSCPKPTKQTKERPSGKDPAYLAALRELPCCICRGWGMVQMSPTQAHHTICGRTPGRKTPDRQAIPLCEDHHQGLWGNDPSKLAIHKCKKTWVAEYGPDTEFIDASRDSVDDYLTNPPCG